MDAVDRMFDLMKSVGLSQKKFASEIGVSEDVVNDWIRRRSSSYSRPKRIEKIAEVLGTTVEYLLTGTPPGQPPYYKQVTGEVCDVDGRFGSGKSGTITAMLEEILSDLSPEALEMARAYDRADKRAKDMVRLALEPFGLSASPNEAM